MHTDHLETLRNRSIFTSEFRKASHQLSLHLAEETAEKLPDRTGGVLIVPILRAGLALLPAFMQKFPSASVGFVGIERDEKTAEPRVYYKKFPAEKRGVAIILDPMLATGGSARVAVQALLAEGYRTEEIFYTGVIGSTVGVCALVCVLPVGNITLSAVDLKLDAKKYIVPGLGDFGDRYFGT